MCIYSHNVNAINKNIAINTRLNSRSLLPTSDAIRTFLTLRTKIMENIQLGFKITRKKIFSVANKEQSSNPRVGKNIKTLEISWDAI